MKVFISGSISIKKLPKTAVANINSIVRKEYTVLVGDANGIDTSVQKYLYKNNYKNVVVYYSGDHIRNNVGSWNTKQIHCKNGEKGRDLFTLKDIEMANDADYGLMIWDGRSKGTLNNISTMKTKNKKIIVIIEELVVDEENIDSILNICAENRQIELF